DVNAPNVPAFNSPAMNVPDVGSTDGWYALAWAGAIAAFGLALWKLWRQQGTHQPAHSAWKPGPRPVPPARIAAAEELSRAFEHFSLLRFGGEARAWNHLDVAAGLANEQPELQHAAEHLAAVYEHARYAPATDSLSDEALIAARHHLCFL